MRQEIRKTVDTLTLRHLYALVVGIVLVGAGWYLSWLITDCRNNKGELTRETMFCRASWLGDLRYYGYRQYGVALIVLAAVFIALVIRDARRNAIDE